MKNDARVKQKREKKSFKLACNRIIMDLTDHHNMITIIISGN